MATTMSSARCAASWASGSTQRHRSSPPTATDSAQSTSWTPSLARQPRRTSLSYGHWPHAGAHKRTEPGRPRPAGLQAPHRGRGRRIPLAVILTGGNRNDVTQLEPLLDAVPNVRGRRGRPRRRPKTIHADRAYDHDKYRRRLRARGITPRIARRGQAHGSGLGTIRRVVERTMCAARRPVVSPVQPGGTWREVPGSNG